ncbi:aromatic prenyltransferase (plasmid) [Streptomyces sp. AD2-2]|nr:aromatic prenyltransferase [Streptomyces sp. AD2-2]
MFEKRHSAGFPPYSGNRRPTPTAWSSDVRRHRRGKTVFGHRGIGPPGGCPCSRDKVRPVLNAFGGTFDNAMVVFSVLTGQHHAGQLDYCFTISPDITDPYATALASGLTKETDHPVASLLAELHAQDWDITEHFTDCSAVSGFKKIYAHFPRDLQKVTTLAALPSMPPAVTANLGLFARHGLDEVAMTGIDYRSRTVSLYFQFTEHNSPRPHPGGPAARDRTAPGQRGDAGIRRRLLPRQRHPRLGLPGHRPRRVRPAPGPRPRPREDPRPRGSPLQHFARAAPAPTPANA